MKLLLILIALVSIGCEKRYVYVDRTPAPEETILIQAERGYGPSTFSPTAVEIKAAGRYETPQVIELVEGAAGTGWAHIDLSNQARLCYQGNGANNNQTGTAFVLKGAIGPGQNCTSVNPKFIVPQSLNLIKGDIVELSVTGGGVSGPLQVRTVVSVNLILN